MQFFKLIGLSLVFLSISSCAALTKADQELMGNIAFGVFSLTLSNNPGTHGQGLTVIVFLKHEESGVIHELSIPFRPDVRIVYLDDLKPGKYTVTEYGTVYGYVAKSNTALHSAVSVDVIGGETILFPKIVSMSEIYLSAGFRSMDNKDYWLSLVDR
ncbi:MAG: hypothetical protein ACI8SR_001141 [Oceanicoccus sp.]|jgi:hypothetical protein